MTQATLSTVKGIIESLIAVATVMFSVWLTPDHILLVNSIGVITWGVFKAVTGVISDNPIFITPPVVDITTPVPAPPPAK